MFKQLRDSVRWWNGAGALVVACTPLAAASAQCLPTWSDLGSGADWQVNGMAWMRDGSGAAGAGRLVIGGGFSAISGVVGPRVLAWDGWTLSPLGTGITDPWGLLYTVRELQPGGGIPAGLYAGGNFLEAGGQAALNIARWGKEWSPVGTGVSALPSLVTHVFAIAQFDPDGPGPLSPRVYVGGKFEFAGGVPAASLASWDGVAWSSVGGGITPLYPGTRPTVYALEEYDDDGPGPRPRALYVAGHFKNAGSVVANRIARWDGQQFEALGTGFNDFAHSLCAFDEDGPGPRPPALFVGGAFSTAGGVAAYGIARWDGSQWSAVGSGLNSTVHSMVVFDDDGLGPNLPSLFAGGFFTQAGSLVVNRVARWDGSQWRALAGGLTGFGQGTEAEVLCVFDEDGPGPNPGGLYVGGLFHFAGGVQTSHIARWGCPLPAGGPCYPDCNLDGALGIADFGCFQTRFALQNPYADCNGDGILNLADFGCFQTKFALGCP